MGCCNSSEAKPQQPSKAAARPTRAQKQSQEEQETTGVQVASPTCEKKSTYLHGSVDTGAAVYIKDTTHGDSGYDTPPSLSILPPPSLRSRDDAQHSESTALAGPGARLLTTFERQFCQAVNALRKAQQVPVLYVSPGLVKTCKIAEKRKDLSILEKATRHGRPGGDTGTTELLFPYKGTQTASDMVNTVDQDIKAILTNGDFGCVGVGVVGEEVGVVLAGEYSDDEGEDGFVPWDVPGSSDVGMTAFEKQIFHELNLLREQPVTYRNILKKELATCVRDGVLHRSGSLSRNSPNLSAKYEAAIAAIGDNALPKIPETTVEAHNKAKNQTEADDLLVSPNEKTAKGVITQALLDPTSRGIMLSLTQWSAVGIHSTFTPESPSLRRSTAIKFIRPDISSSPPGPGGPKLSELEMAIFEELNEARTSPSSYAEHIKSLLLNVDADNKFCEPGKTPVALKEGQPAFEEAIRFLNETAPLEKYTTVPAGLQQAARDHATDSEGGLLGHTGSDGSTLSERLSKHGSVSGGMAENISYGRATARGIVTQLIIDDGVPSRGHRKNIFNGDYAMVGIAAGPHAKYTYCCVIDFAANYTDKA